MKLTELMQTLNTYQEEFGEYDVKIESESPIVDDIEVYISSPDDTVIIQTKKITKFQKPR